jgi:hypothetical protein
MRYGYVPVSAHRYVRNDRDMPGKKWITSGSAKQSLGARTRCTGYRDKITQKLQPRASVGAFFLAVISGQPPDLEKLENQLGACPLED